MHLIRNMKKITTTHDLKEAILELEIRKANESMALKKELINIKEKLKPANFVKNAFKEVTESSAVRENILTGAVGLAAGYVAKKILFGTTSNPLKKMAGTILQMGVAGSASGIKSL